MINWFRREKLESKEYLELITKLENLRINVEALKIDFELTRNKLKKKAGLQVKEEDDETKDLNKSVLLNPNGNPLEDIKKRL